MKIELECGESLFDVCERLLSLKDSIITYEADFNGNILTSDMTLDEMYLKVTGYTKKDYDEKEKRERLEYLDRQEKHKEKIPELIKVYKEKAKKVLDDKYLSKWESILEVRLSDLYKGAELQCTLDIIYFVNDDRFESARNMFISQGHSGMSASLVKSMIIAFSDRGSAFVDFLNKNN